jgi:flagellar hook-basal body complex protein FliE
MPSPILPISLPAAIPDISKPGGKGGSDAFPSFFRDAVQRVEQFGQAAEASTERFLSGESEEVHQTVLATQQAELALEMFLQVRNKMVQAYQEVMRMQM